MKKLVLPLLLLVAVLLSACEIRFSKPGISACEEHKSDCIPGENCSDHPNCYAHEKCPVDKVCTEHPECEAFAHKTYRNKLK
jgi:hypothetical protein